MAVTEMASVALVEDHHNAAILNLLKFAAIPRSGDGGIEFLDRRNDDFGVALKTARKFACVGCAVNRTRLKSIIFRLGLSVEVMTVNNEHHLINAVKFGNELGRFERGQGLSGSGSVPNVSVAVGVLHLVDNLLNSIILIWAKHHERLITLVHHNIFANHLAKSTLVKKISSEKTQFVKGIV